MAPRKVFTIHGTRFEVDGKYEVKKAIGFGSYGYVCSGTNTESQERVAIKKIPKVFKDLIDGKRILREIKLLSHFNHENVISIRDIMKPRSKSRYEDIYIVNELMDTDLHQVIRSKQKLSDEHHQYFIYQVLRGLKYIHSASVLHRDLKPSNLLVNGNCDLKICDFGLARAVDPADACNLTEYVVTRWYRPPELLLMCPTYSREVDVWSVGCIMAELINRRPLFPGKDYVHQLQLIFEVMGTPAEHETRHVTNPEAVKYLKNLKPRPPQDLRRVIPAGTPEALDLIRRMLAFDPKERITVEEALAHPYLAALHDPTDEPVHGHPFSFEFDKSDMGEPALRDALWQEAMRYHQDDLQEEDSEEPVEIPADASTSGPN
jgi:serine/threonine protein kinase